MNKVVICTGANGGIGRNYCHEMLTLGYHVVLACRNEISGQQTLDALKAEFPGKTMELMCVDMANIDSIKRFSDQFKERYNRLDVLVHNAGIYFFDKEKRLSHNGYELNMALHFVGPYALTLFLLPILKRTPDARVIVMSSTEHRGNPVDTEDLMMEKNWAKIGNMGAYGRSKWAGMAMVYELHSRFQANGLQIHALAAHPGVSITGIQHAGNPNIFQKGIIWLIGKIVAGKPEDAAKPLVIASTKGKSGEFYGPTGFKEFKGKPGLVKPDAALTDSTKRKALIEFAESLTGVPLIL